MILVLESQVNFPLSMLGLLRVAIHLISVSNRFTKGPGIMLKDVKMCIARRFILRYLIVLPLEIPIQGR